MNDVVLAPRRPADNPFASHRVDNLPYRHCDPSPRDLDRRLAALGGRAAVVGPKGSGKTTLVHQLRSRANGRPVSVSIPAGCRNPWRTARAQLPISVTAEHAVTVDGAEHLGPIGWRRLLRATRKAGSLLVTLHRPGRLPTLIECHTDPDLLRDLVRKLAPIEAPILGPHLDELFHRHEGNVRECFRELYDVFAGRSSANRSTFER